MAYRRDVRRHGSLRRALHCAVRLRCGFQALDEILDGQPGVHPSMLRLRHHSLPSDGCGHYLQARPSLYRGNGRHRHRFFYRDRLDYRRTLIEFGRTLTNEVRLEPMLGSVMDRVSQTLLVDRLAIFVEDSQNPGEMRLARSMGVRLSERLDLSFLKSATPELANNTIFFESSRSVPDVADSVRRTVEQLDLNYFIPCRIRERTVAFLGLGKTVDGDFPSSDDVELVQTIAGYLAIALDNSQLYTSLEQKAFEVARLKDFSENIVESLNVGVLAVDLYGTVEAWNSRME